MIYIVLTDRPGYGKDCFGAYSSLLKARNAIIDICAGDVEDLGNYVYKTCNDRGEYIWFEIVSTTIDE